VDELSSALTISGKLAYPLLRLDSIIVGSAVMNDFEVVVWGRPIIPPEILAILDGDTLHPSGNSPIIANRSNHGKIGGSGSSGRNPFTSTSYDMAVN
jgi:hypothetical protein